MTDREKTFFWISAQHLDAFFSFLKDAENFVLGLSVTAVLLPFLIRSSLKGRTHLWFYTVCRTSLRGGQKKHHKGVRKTQVHCTLLAEKEQKRSAKSLYSNCSRCHHLEKRRAGQELEREGCSQMLLVAKRLSPPPSVGSQTSPWWPDPATSVIQRTSLMRNGTNIHFQMSHYPVN